MFDFHKVKAGAAVLADAAVKTGGELYEKGKKQAALMALESKLSRAQRQLGALVYALRKNGDANEALVARYCDAIAQIEQQMEQLGATAAPAAESTAASGADAAVSVLCPQCGAEVDPSAIFCPGCGCKLD